MQNPGCYENSRSEREFLDSLDDVSGQYPLRVTALRRPLDGKVLVKATCMFAAFVDIKDALSVIEDN